MPAKKNMLDCQISFQTSGVGNFQHLSHSITWDRFWHQRYKLRPLTGNTVTFLRTDSWRPHEHITFKRTRQKMRDATRFLTTFESPQKLNWKEQSPRFGFQRGRVCVFSGFLLLFSKFLPIFCPWVKKVFSNFSVQLLKITIQKKRKCFGQICGWLRFAAVSCPFLQASTFYVHGFSFWLADATGKKTQNGQPLFGQVFFVRPGAHRDLMLSLVICIFNPCLGGWLWSLLGWWLAGGGIHREVGKAKVSSNMNHDLLLSTFSKAAKSSNSSIFFGK